MREVNYLKAVVVVHGKSELQICQYIKQKLRLNIEIESDKKGTKAIQITSLKNTLNKKYFKKQSEFLKRFGIIKLDKKGQKIADGFKIFIIMDTDDCSDKQIESFKNKEMFKGYWAYDHIVPIYNSKNLEEVLEKAGVPFEKKGKDKKKEYVKLFPTDKKYEKSNVMEIEDLKNKLIKVKNTNLDEFINFCLEESK